MRKFLTTLCVVGVILGLTACGGNKTSSSKEVETKTESVKAETESVTEETESSGQGNEVVSEKVTEPAASSTDGMRPEFKEAMDSYELFFGEYIEFMKKYQDSQDTTSMLTDYTEYLTQYAEAMGNMSAVSEDELSADELRYYLEVTVRITQKLSEITR